MKKLILLLLISAIAGSVQQSMAQASLSSIGLYLTTEDYLNHKLSYEVDQENTKTNKLFIHQFFDQNNITVVTGGKKLQFKKSGIFGYHDKYNHDYRFYKSEPYRIEDTTDFYIYSQEKVIQEEKKPKPYKIYYFSTKINTLLLPLTEECINKAFVKNRKFRYLVEGFFKSDQSLSAFDAGSGKYKIKEFYDESLNN